VKEEQPDGRPRLVLLVDPAPGSLLAALVRIGDPERVAQLQWRRAGWLEARRERPNHTRAGKILHLHQRADLPR
jgi:hypothetical protein